MESYVENIKSDHKFEKYEWEIAKFNQFSASNLLNRFNEKNNPLFMEFGKDKLLMPVKFSGNISLFIEDSILYCLSMRKELHSNLFINLWNTWRRYDFFPYSNIVSIIDEFYSFEFCLLKLLLYGYVVETNMIPMITSICKLDFRVSQLCIAYKFCKVCYELRSLCYRLCKFIYYKLYYALYFKSRKSLN